MIPDLMKLERCRIFVLGGLAAASLLGGCRPPSAEDMLERLPDLPPDLVATLDPETMATRMPPGRPPLEREQVAAAPCCSITDDKALRVTYAYTKCGPLRDFIIAPLAESILFRSAPGTTQSYRLRRFQGRLLDQHVCFTSRGPWNARLTEERSCIGYAPVHTLTISAYGDLIVFVWNGGVQNHPPQVGLVSCRQLFRLESLCNDALSECKCVSSSCSASEPCACTLPW